MAYYIKPTVATLGSVGYYIKPAVATLGSVAYYGKHDGEDRDNLFHFLCCFAPSFGGGWGGLFLEQPVHLCARSVEGTVPRADGVGGETGDDEDALG